MNKQTLGPNVIGAALACLLALHPLAALAQATQDGQSAVSINNTAGRVQVKLERGSKVAVSNRYGNITITGWERDTVEAVATSEQGAEAIQVELTADPQARTVLTLAVRGRGGARRAFMPGMDFEFEYYLPDASGTGSGTGRGMGRGMGSGIGGGTGGGDGQGRGASPDGPQAPDKTKEKDKHKPAAEGNVVITPRVFVQPDGVVVVTPQTAPAVPPPPPPTSTPPPPRPAPRVVGPRGVTPPQAPLARASRIDLDVKVPRYAELSTIQTLSGNLTVSNIDGPVAIASANSAINVSRVGALEVRARGGSVNIEDVAGLAYVVTTSGPITVRRANGDVRAVSLGGDTDIACVRGRVDVSNARGAIKLTGIRGDVDATTTNSDISYTGAINNNGRYRLKSVEGEVRMAIPAGSPGFTANMASYNGEVQTDFAVRHQNQTTMPTGANVNRRVEAREGDGQAQITLDSFSKSVRLVRLATGTSASCQ